MRLNSLHNALFVAAKLLRAEMVAVKLIPAAHLEWPHQDIVVGDTQQLIHLGWQDGSAAPEPTRASARHKQSLFGVENALTAYPHPDSNGFTASLSITETILDALPGQFLQTERRASAQLPVGEIWFATTLESGSQASTTLLSSDTDQNLLELILGVSAQVLWGMYHGAMLQRDPLTALPGPAELRHRLQLNIAQSRAAKTNPKMQGIEPTGTLLVLLELDNLSLLRRHLKPDETQTLLIGTADALRSALRRNDGLFRYSDNAFAVCAEVSDGSATQVIEKLKTAWQDFSTSERFNGVSVSIGYSAELSRTSDASAFLLCVEQALDQALNRPGNQIVEANLDQPIEHFSSGQPTGGVFTNDPMIDYRNSRVLWHTTSLIASATNSDVLGMEFSRLLQDVLSLQHADVLTQTDNGLRHAHPSEPRALPAELVEFIEEAVASGQTRQRINESNTLSDTDKTLRQIAVPLVSRNQAIGALLIEPAAPVEDSDLVFLRALADQIAGALDRLELAEQQALLSKRESSSLRAEIAQLRDKNTASSSHNLIAESQAMSDVLDYVKKIAPTDASVLILGESGAGKEVMAKAIVAASSRADRPLITVDCSAIAHSLIDSELFGRVKGAFTGADAASSGRIAQADGGTLFLDEIGELPMDVQAKLLRFVQEKELIAVGDTQPQKIDTRIICATNRDLLLESTRGRFRSDLYYRLQVLQVTVPPLRERLADIPALVNSFAGQYAQQFGKTIDGLTDAAWQKINQHNWPGNIRELQNAIVRATLTAETSYIDAIDLQFGEELPVPDQSVLSNEEPNERHGDARPTRHTEHSLSADGYAPETVISGPDLPEADHNWDTLASLLGGQVTALINDARLEAPLGRWLSDTVVLTAVSVSEGIARQAARLLGIPETTLRRQLNKARQNQDNPFQLMSPQWLTSLPALTDLLRSLMEQDGEDSEFADRCQALLLQQVANHIGNDRKAGAALMGITPPTYARWLKRYAIEPQQLEPAGATTKFKLEQKYS